MFIKHLFSKLNSPLVLKLIRFSLKSQLKVIAVGLQIAWHVKINSSPSVIKLDATVKLTTGSSKRIEEKIN